MISVKFKVHGRVQGVSFRKHTKEKSIELGLRGWCMNTDEGTVVGVVEGEEDKVSQMKVWLQKTGSPQSLIDHVDFEEEQTISKFTYDTFDIRQ